MLFFLHLFKASSFSFWGPQMLDVVPMSQYSFSGLFIQKSLCYLILHAKLMYFVSLISCLIFILPVSLNRQALEIAMAAGWTKAHNNKLIINWKIKHKFKSQFFYADIGVDEKTEDHST
jgi:hypothetical protein